MVTSTLLEKNPIEELNECIINAMSKVGVQKETDLSRYIPGKKGHLHHFAFVKLKKTSPDELQQMIQEYILDKEKPELVFSAPKPALKMKRTVELTIKKSMINQLLNVLKISKVDGADDLIAMSGIPAREIVTSRTLNDFDTLKRIPFSHLKGTLYASKIF